LEWWSYIPGANWRHPNGPESDIKGKEKFPVVQVAYADAALRDWLVGKKRQR
jgi:sulfatase modifying factor 1